MNETPILSWTLQGEAGTCGFYAMVAIAYALTSGRAGPFYGHQAPDDMAVFVANWWFFFADPTPTARYFFSREDTHKPAVQRIVGHDPPVAVFECAGNLRLYAY